MVFEVRLEKHGEDEAFLRLPDEALAHLGLEEGDSVLLTSLEQGVMRISKVTPEFRRQMEVVDDVMKRYQNTFRALRDAGD